MCFNQRIFTLFIILTTIGMWSCTHPTERMDSYTCHGIDLSHHQSRVNWDTIRKQGIAFGFVKATEGVAHIDSQFVYNWNEMKRVGIIRGAYHFFRPDQPAMDQALHFIRNVTYLEGDLPPVLDVEVPAMNDSTLHHRLSTWLQIVESYYCVKPIVYSYMKYYNARLYPHYNQYPLWIARYSNEEPELKKSSKWTFWQYGDKGTLKGVSGYLDFNVYEGTLNELDTLRMDSITMACP